MSRRYKGRDGRVENSAFGISARGIDVNNVDSVIVNIDSDIDDSAILIAAGLRDVG